MSYNVIAVIVMMLNYAAGYLVSLYALAIHVDPDEVEVILPRVSRRWHGFLTRLANDPMALVQIAVVFKSFGAILIGAVSLPMLVSIAHRFEVEPIVVCAFGLALEWLFFVFVVEYLPRRTSREAINEGMTRHLWLVSMIYYCFLPLVRVYRSALQRAGKGKEVTEEEKEDLIERAIETLADEAGIGERIMEDDEREMISQIFLLDQTVVKEIMIPRIHITAIDQAMSYLKIRELVARDGHSRYPVYDGSIDTIVGLIYVKDLFNRMPAPGEPFVIRDFLREPYFVPESKVIGELLREFRDKRLHIALVVDEYGGVAGLVTLEDIIEEIVGDIQDEHDWEQEDFQPLTNGWNLVGAGLLVEELQEHLGTEYEYDENDTVGGLIYDLVGSVPTEGQSIRWNDIEFEVEKVEGQRIVSVRVKRLTQPSQGTSGR